MTHERAVQLANQVIDEAVNSCKEVFDKAAIGMVAGVLIPYMARMIYEQVREENGTIISAIYNHPNYSGDRSDNDLTNLTLMEILDQINRIEHD